MALKKPIEMAQQKALWRATMMVSMRAYPMVLGTTVQSRAPSKDVSMVLTRAFQRAMAKDPQKADPMEPGMMDQLKGPSMDLSMASRIAFPMAYWTALATWSDTRIQTLTELPKANSKAEDQQTAGSMVWSTATMMVPMRAYLMDPVTTVPLTESSKDVSTVLPRAVLMGMAKDPPKADPMEPEMMDLLREPSTDS